MEEVRIDRAIYLVDRRNKTYQFLKRNAVWKNLSLEENLLNKKSIDGYTRTISNGKTKIFKFKQ